MSRKLQLRTDKRMSKPMANTEKEERVLGKRSSGFNTLLDSVKQTDDDDSGDIMFDDINQRPE